MPGTTAHPVRSLPVILRALADLEEELAGDTGGRARGRQRVRS